MVSVAAEFTAIVVPLAAAAGLVVGVRFMACHDAFGEATRNLPFRWDGPGTFRGDVFP